MKPVARCPKCKSAELKIFEYSTGITAFEQDAAGNIDPEGFHSEGCVTGIRCICHKCGHRWRPRGAKQITDLQGYPELGKDGERYTR